MYSPLSELMPPFLQALITSHLHRDHRLLQHSDSIPFNGYLSRNFPVTCAIAPETFGAKSASNRHYELQRICESAAPMGFANRPPTAWKPPRSESATPIEKKPGHEWPGFSHQNFYWADTIQVYWSTVAVTDGSKRKPRTARTTQSPRAASPVWLETTEAPATFPPSIRQVTLIRPLT